MDNRVRSNDGKNENGNVVVADVGGRGFVSIVIVMLL